MKCTECDQSSSGTCKECGTAKCTIHMVQTYRRHHTGLSVGGRAVTQEGYESAGFCVACRDQRQSAAIEGLRAASDPTDVVTRISAGLLPHVGAPTNVVADQAWGLAVREAWAGLVSRGVVGEPIHDLLELSVRGRNARLSFVELSRTPVWRARDAGRRYLDANSDSRTVVDHAFDVWVRSDAHLFPPYWANSSNGGGLHVLKRDLRGGVWAPDPLMLVVPVGCSPQTRTRGRYYERTVELVDGVTVTSRYGLHEGDGCSYGLAQAIAALVKHGAAK